MSALAEVIEQAEVRWSDDSAKANPELVCMPCGEVVCDVEHEDTLGVLARTFADHECPPADDGEG